ncbi:MAG: hypothetical protein H6519_10870 [Microthrixaceae bacterium]|nr:hypothetical protein [Acidimicrobiales bacterium]MCB9404922.1 hypothetical protein [Microthrixaceae bacterium]
MAVAVFAPIFVLLCGAVVAMVVARRLADESEALDASLRRLDRVENALIPVRVETRHVRRSSDQITRR